MVQLNYGVAECPSMSYDNQNDDTMLQIVLWLQLIIDFTEAFFTNCIKI